MRRYQQRLADDLSRVYRSKDPLKWVFLAVKLNADRMPSDRERKLFMRRVTRMAGRAAEQITANMAAFAASVSQAAGSIKSFVDSMKHEESA